MQPVRLGLVGLGFGKIVAGELTGNPNLPVKLAKVCDLNATLAKEMSTQFGVPISPSLAALLADDEIDAVGLYTQPPGRAELVRKIIRGGKHVMTTKPFEIDAAATLSVLREAQSLGKVVHLNSPNARPFGEMEIIQRWIAQGDIGTPYLAQANVWVYYGATKPSGSWADDPLRCPLSPIFRLGIYPLNNLLTIFGEPKTVQATHSRLETQAPPPDNASLTIGFKSGAIANIVGSYVIGGPDKYKNAMTIAGSKGVIYYLSGPRAREGFEQPELILSNDQGIQTAKPTAHTGLYDWEFFAARIRGQVKQDVTTPEQIAAAVRVVQAMSKAELTGQTVTLD